ncbi:hypothetical protein F5Y15DRAFT_416966 [Xylariaceae sp. FL0016]|nr:hypothetical protein F5Y15DRAFT_416966 [Xylariaceae sp. FL0016]
MRTTAVLALFTTFLAATSAPVPIDDPLLDNLPDTILSSVSDLLGYPKHPQDGDTNCFLSKYNPSFCVGTCAGACIKGAQACSDCLQKCYKAHSCDQDENDGANGQDGENGKNGPSAKFSTTLVDPVADTSNPDDGGL